jgi:hypothetical protein
MNLSSVNASEKSSTCTILVFSPFRASAEGLNDASNNLRSLEMMTPVEDVQLLVERRVEYDSSKRQLRLVQNWIDPHLRVCLNA